jgi:hypothetical protein
VHGQGTCGQKTNSADYDTADSSHKTSPLLHLLKFLQVEAANEGPDDSRLPHKVQ